MPSFVSKNGIWEAAKERAFDPKTGEIYDGPDRAATEVLNGEGGTMGQDASKDPQLLQASRNAGFNNIDDYLKHFAPKPKEVEAIKEAQNKIVTHANTPSKLGVTGGTKGGFQKDDESADQALSKKG